MYSKPKPDPDMHDRCAELYYGNLFTKMCQRCQLIYWSYWNKDLRPIISESSSKEEPGGTEK